MYINCITDLFNIKLVRGMLRHKRKESSKIQKSENSSITQCRKCTERRFTGLIALPNHHDNFCQEPK